MPRVYAPADLGRLARWHADGVVAGVASGAPERLLAPDDDEASEHAALTEAAADSAALAGPGERRVVVVLDTAADPDADLPWRDVVAVHADLADPAGGAATGGDLAWVAVQEVARLLDGTL